MSGITRMMYIGLVFWLVVSGTGISRAQETSDIGEMLKKKAQEGEQMREKREAEAKAARQEAAKAKARLKSAKMGKQWARIEQLDLPEDTTARFNVKRLQISGNTLISTDELLEDMPLVYNASTAALEEADSSELYDLRTVHEVIAQPGEPRRVSARTVQGLTQYVLSAYQARNYAGVYVY
ncbi:MAG: hypothetical protein ACYS6I_01645, partial [Planctomycetota bacterium]